ncbi:uncharacterized protein L201_007091 [Kwoniella dendrophila CBS 6074]|uniref:DNA replication regulator Sld3 C-terminal domain-containing protein n=1 Tax=Kwoniella dendrophila CBS 6074 TaxID=1295534 RepID=A0AAX4K3K3_9TREE
MATLVESPQPIANSSNNQPILPFRLDLTCPIALPSKPLTTGLDWPYVTAGPSTYPEETTETFIKRRYYETLYLSEVLSPLPGFTSDVLEIFQAFSNQQGRQNSSNVIKAILLSLPQIEHKHRKVILPILTSSASSSISSSTEKLSDIEMNVIKFALELRLSSRQAIDDGIIPTPKKLIDELEKRETLIQIILLLIYIQFGPMNAEQPTKKRKRSKRSHRAELNDTPTALDPIEDPKTALELLIDRLSVWQAVSELGISIDQSTESSSKVKGKSKIDENSIANILGRFWKSVMLPYFLSEQPDLCSLFHQKVFGHPLPPKLLPAPNASSSTSTTKKPRKPKLTRPILSKDSLIPRPPPSYDRPRSISNEGLSIDERRRSLSGTGSRAPSDNGNASALKHEPPLDMKRSLSRSNTDLNNNHSSSAHNIGGFSRSLSRSRSRSIEPSLSRSESLSRSISHGIGSSSNLSSNNNNLLSSSRTISRNKSSKDLFKGREVNLLRRSTSSKKSLDSILGRGGEDSQSQSQNLRLGLLGRKTSSGKNENTQRRNSTEESQKPPNTLILATPSKPRNQSHSFFRSNQSQSQFPAWVPPTPIREEPSSASRPNYIAETPMAPTRIANKDMLPLDGLPDNDDHDEGMESDDPLGELWELTEDEDENEDHPKGRGRNEMVPETPMK